MPADQSEIVFNTKQLADAFDMTPRRVQQLAEEGVFPKAGRGKYLAIDCIKNYINSLQTKTGGGTVDLDYERALHERAKRAKTELLLAEMKGDLHRSDDVMFIMNDMISSFRSKILAMPSKISPQLVGKTEIPVILELLANEVRTALSELSEYDPAKFREVSREYVELGSEDDED
ncbi:hypothetical protein ACFOQM_12500 [Paenibacillus sp. GCM10012307]|uniref:Terminase small subunit n=1 Tax=Paenibacillus roseus TaxID=2798579 RepID=A0A934MVH0_9BACL|nr:hypothetical protein [Paenibacillus roseus]MBJ6362112.1 hypothetical protein [Paenibacillus roseus]